MPVFLNREQVYRLLQRELPAGIYPDGAPSAYFSTADMDAVAAVAATGYANLERIYENNWPMTADERIADWEIVAFGYNLPVSLTLAERQDRVTEKIRSRKGLTIADMVSLVKAIIGTDKLVEAIEWGCSSGGWMIGVSQLGVETYLNGFPSRLTVTGPLICEADPADYGYTQEQWDQMREDAYTYQINVYDYTLTDAEYDAIDAALTIAEPARSAHVIKSGLDADLMVNP